MSLDTKFLLEKMEKLFAKQNAHWDRWFADRDAKWDHRWSSQSGSSAHTAATEKPPSPTPSSASPPAPTATAAPPEGADAEGAVPLAKLVARMTSTAVRAAGVVDGAEPLSASRLQPGATAEREVLVPTTAGMAEILDVERTDEIRNGFDDIAPTDEIRTSVVNFEPSDEIRSDGCLTPAVVAPTKSVAVFPIAGCVAPASVLTSTNPDMLAGIAPTYACVAPVPASCLSSDEDDTTMCSTDCLNRNFILLKTICAPPSSTHAPATPSTEDEATNNSSAGSFEYIQVQYISISTLSDSFGVVSLPGMATRVPSVKQMFEGLITQQSVMLVPMFQHMVSKAPWPPPIQCVMHIGGAELRPIPWPSFGYRVVHYASCQHNKKDKDCVLWILWNISWLFSALVHWSSDNLAAATMITRAHILFQFYPSRFGPLLQGPVIQHQPVPWPFFRKHSVALHWLNLLSMVYVDSATEIQNLGFCQMNLQWPEFLANALQADGFIWELAAYLFQSSVGAVLFAVDTSKGVLGNYQYLSACITFLLHLITTRRPIMLSCEQDQWSTLLVRYRSVVVFQLTILQHADFGKGLIDSTVNGSEIFQEVTRGILLAKLIDLYKVQTLAKCTQQDMLVLSLHIFPSPPLTSDQIGVAIIKTEEDAYGNSEISGDASNIIFILFFYNLVIEDP